MLLSNPAQLESHNKSSGSSFLIAITAIYIGVTVFSITSPEKLVPVRAFLNHFLGFNTQAIVTTKLPPTSIRIPALHKTLPIQAALIHNNQWDLFDSSVAWLSTSQVPGEGNVILYAHDWTSLFGDLKTLRYGDIIEVQQNGEWKKYAVVISKAVSPDDVASIMTSNNQLTLYTCEGTFDQKRRVVYALPSDATL
jgi:LPXTG-site transpeptidase (sortase) family protein